MTFPLRAVGGELLGSALLTTVVVGSGIAAQRLSTDTGLQLLENALVTALGLTVLILVFAPVSGAHFNPVVTVVETILSPVENATGNFTKVAQRIPVRIRIEPGQAGVERLAPGMSVVAKVDTGG